MEVPGTVKVVESMEEYRQIAQRDGTLAVTFFWADFHQPSTEGGQLDVMYTQLAMLQPKLKFLKVEAEKVQDVAEMFDISMVPTFVFTQGTSVLDKLQGANVSELANRVNVLSKSLESSSKTEGKVSEAMKIRLEKLITSAPVMLFMKGNPQEPKCGFSRKTVQILNSEKIQFGSFDILTDQDVRQALKTYSDWPTYPQLYVHGKLIGGLDILVEMLEDGNLQDQLDVRQEQEQVTRSLNDTLKELIESAPVLLFMKGSPQAPQCGFSRTIVNLLRDHDIQFSTFDILSDDQVRQGLKAFSNWPTYPQLYVDGKLVGGLDIVTEMAEEGDLAQELGIQKKPKVEIDLKALIQRSPVMVFMKGTRTEPQCGFSRSLIGLLNAAGFEYDTFDILTNDQVRQGLKKFSNWPTYPQLYIKGELIGGLDIVKELADEDELESLKP